MVGQNCRFTSAFEKAKVIIDSGTIGEHYFVESAATVKIVKPKYEF